MNARYAIVPVIVAACLLAGPSTASATSFNWGSLSNLFNSLKQYSSSNSHWNVDWDKCDTNGYFSFTKGGKHVTKVDFCDIDKYICKDNKSYFGGYKGFKLYKKDWSKWWDFDCVTYVPCPPPTPDDCKVVPTPAAAWAGLGLIGLLGAGRTLRRSNREIHDEL